MYVKVNIFASHFVAYQNKKSDKHGLSPYLSHPHDCGRWDLNPESDQENAVKSGVSGMGAQKVTKKVTNS